MYKNFIPVPSLCEYCYKIKPGAKMAAYVDERHYEFLLLLCRECEKEYEKEGELVC